MNPDIIKAARALVKAQQKYPDLTNDEADAIARSHGVELSGVVDYVNKLRADGGNLVASGLEGFTANLGDELVGLLPKALGGGEAGKEEMRLRQELAHLDHPVASTTAELAGGLGSAVLGGGALLGEAVAPVAGMARVGRAALSGVEAGGAYGAMAGAGAGETSEERSSGAAAGALGGMALGGLGGGVVATAMELTPAATVLRAHLTAIEKSGGMRALRAKLADFAGTGRGEDVVAADVSPYFQHNLREAAKKDLGINIEADKMLSERGMGADRRTITDVASNTGSAPDAVALAKALKDEQFQWANTAYDKLRNQKVEFMPEDLNKFIDKPTIDAALQRAKLAGDITGSDELAQLMERIKAGSRDPKDVEAIKRAVNGGGLQGMRPITFDDLQVLQQTLDHKAGLAFKPGGGAHPNVPLGRAYKAVRQQVLDAIQAKIPEFADVQAEATAKYRLQEAVKEGMETWTEKGTRNIAQDLNNLPEKDRAAFRYSMASRLVDQLRDNPTSILPKLQNPSISMQEKLQAIFGEKYNDFLKRTGVEKVMNETLAAVRVTPPGTVPNPAASVAHSALYGPKYAAVNILGKMFGHPHGSRVAQTMGHDMMTQGAERVSQLLDKLEEPISLFHRGHAAVAGQTGNLLFRGRH